MNAQQQAALEALAGRTFTSEEVAELTPLVSAGSWAWIALVINRNRTKVGSHFASERGVLERYPGGPLAADALLKKLEDYAATDQQFSSVTTRAIRFLRQPEGLDIGSPATQAMLGALVQANVISSTEFAGLRQMALRADPVTDAQVKQALEG